MVTYRPGSESGIISLRLGVTSLYTSFLIGYTAALVVPTKFGRPPAYAVSGTTDCLDQIKLEEEDGGRTGGGASIEHAKI